MMDEIFIGGGRGGWWLRICWPVDAGGFDY